MAKRTALLFALALLAGGCATRQVLVERRLLPVPANDSALVLLHEELAKSRGGGPVKVTMELVGGGSMDIRHYKVYRQPVDPEEADTSVTLNAGAQLTLMVEGEGAIFVSNRGDRPATIRISLD